MAARRSPQKAINPIQGYDSIVLELSELIESARRLSARSVNAVMTATYWEIGRRIVESEQRGKKRAEYGEALLERLAADLTAKFGRGFGVRNLWLMRRFFAHWPEDHILQTVSAESQSIPQGPSKTSEIVQTPSAESSFKQLKQLVRYFPLPWSHYVRLMGGSKWWNPFTWFNKISEIYSEVPNPAVPEESPTPIPDRKPGFSTPVPLEITPVSPPKPPSVPLKITPASPLKPPLPVQTINPPA